MRMISRPSLLRPTIQGSAARKPSIAGPGGSTPGPTPSKGHFMWARRMAKLVREKRAVAAYMHCMPCMGKSCAMTSMPRQWSPHLRGQLCCIIMPGESTKGERVHIIVNGVEITIITIDAPAEPGPMREGGSKAPVQRRNWLPRTGRTGRTGCVSGFASESHRRA